MSICASCSSSKPIRRRCSTPTPPLSANTSWPIPLPARCWRNRLRQRGRQPRLRMRSNRSKSWIRWRCSAVHPLRVARSVKQQRSAGLLMGGAVPLAQPDEPVQPPAPPSPPPIAAQPQAPRPQPTPPPVQTPEPQPQPAPQFCQQEPPAQPPRPRQGNRLGIDPVAYQSAQRQHAAPNGDTLEGRC